MGAVGFHIDRHGISEVGRISHPPLNGNTPPITRSIVISGRLYTLSDEGILASALRSLAPLAFVAFPATAPPTLTGRPGVGVGDGDLRNLRLDWRSLTEQPARGPDPTRAG
jgi:hypothetical protein